MPDDINRKRPYLHPGIRLSEVLATTIGTSMSLRKSPGEIARAVMDDVALALRTWADETDECKDAPFDGLGLRWAADEFSRERAPFGKDTPDER